MTDAPDLSAEAVIDELREEALLLEQTAWSRLDGGQDWLLSATLATRAADILRTLSAENARLRADIAAAERKGAEGWQTMATAPRDGTPIIGGIFAAPWADQHIIGRIVKCWWQTEFDAFITGCSLMTLAEGYTFKDGASRLLHSPDIEQVTHWLPLPPAPTGHDDSGGHAKGDDA